MFSVRCRRAPSGKRPRACLPACTWRHVILKCPWLCTHDLNGGPGREEMQGKGGQPPPPETQHYSSPHRTFRIRAESKRPALPGGMDGGPKLASVRPSARGILNKLLELTTSRQQARGEAGSSSSVLGEPLQFLPRRSLPCSIPLLLGSLPAKVSLRSPSPENWLSDRTAYS